MKIHIVPQWLNTIALLIGVGIVWFQTHDGIAVIGCFVAALHFTFSLEVPNDFEKEKK